MLELRLVDYNSPPLRELLSEYRIFLLEPSSGVWKQHFLRSERERFRFAAGWGSEVYVGKKKLSRSLAAVYLLERNIEVFINGFRFDAAAVGSAQLSDWFPLGRTLKLVMKDGQAAEFNYATDTSYGPNDSNLEHDFFSYLAEILGNPLALKVFAYEWSASVVGRVRSLRLTAKDVAGLDDPFDVNRDVADF